MKNKSNHKTMSQVTNFTPEQGGIEKSTKNSQSVTSDWLLLQELLDGVRVKEVKNVPKDNGILVEVFRRDWALDEQEVEQVFQVMLFSKAISAWHVHQYATDRIFINQGLIKVVLYDARQYSMTYGHINEFRFGSARPALVVIPPGVWHGVQNLSKDVSCLLNVVDKAYCYEDPDHWTLPVDTKAIPYCFTKET